MKNISTAKYIWRAYLVRCTDGVEIIVDREYYREVLALYKVAIMSKLPVSDTMGIRLKVKGQVGSSDSDRGMAR